MVNEELVTRFERLNAIAIELSTERSLPRLLESILRGAKELTNADAGTLYLRRGDHLHFEIVFADSLNLYMGGENGGTVTFPAVPLFDDGGTPNYRNVVSRTAHELKIINIPDIYLNKEFDFSGTYQFDQSSGFRSQSFLSVPMCDHEGKLLGVLQLINAVNPKDGTVIPFKVEDERLVAALASQASVALTRKKLMDELEHLLQSLVKLIATAIDEKSPYTAGHCRRVPELVSLIVRKINEEQEGPYGDVFFNEEELKEIELAAWLHDCGKITTPEYVVDKRTKLETIFDRIKLVETRIDLFEREAQIAMLHQILEKNGEESRKLAVQNYQNTVQKLEEIRQFLQRVNQGGEFLDEKDKEKIFNLSQMKTRYSPDGKQATLLTKDEVENLCVPRGTLTVKERSLIQNHIVATVKMLNSLPFPENLKNVPKIAGAHHERLDGKGYPAGLSAPDLSLPERILALADIFEALTAPDRPYRPPMPLSRALQLLSRMADDGHLDPELVRFFIEKSVYLSYVQKNLSMASCSGI